MQISSELISSSKIGKTLNRFVKDRSFEGKLHKQAEDLVLAWKDIVNRQKKRKTDEVTPVQLGKRTERETPLQEVSQKRQNVQDNHEEDLELLQQLESKTKKVEAKKEEVKPVVKKQAQEEAPKAELFFPQRPNEPHTRKPNKKGFMIQFKPD